MSLKFIGDRDSMYIYPWYISDITSTKDLEKVVGVKVNKAFIVIENDFLSFYYDEASANKVGLAIYDKITKERKFFEKICKKIYSLSDAMLDFGKQLEKQSVSEMKDKELLAIYEAYTKQLIALRTWGWVPVFLDGLDKSFLSVKVQGDLEKFLKRKKIDDNASQIYSILSSSEKMSEVQQEELARLEMIKKIEASSEGKKALTDIRLGEIDGFLKKYPMAAKLVNKHLKNYGWLTYAYSGPQMDIAYLFSVLEADVAKGDFSGQISEIKEHFATIGDKKRALVSKYRLPDNLVYLLEVSSELMFIKDFRKGTYQKSYVFMDRVMDELARRLSLSNKEIKYLILSEVKAALAGKFKEVQNIAKERTAKCCYVAEQGKIDVYSGVNCAKMIKRLVPKAKASMPIVDKQFKGMVAYSGKVTGIVKIVLVKGDIAKVNEGDILVSSATNPDLIVAMKRAAAFVTDFGGIISHAAIVSRELKKPCIVGTRIGTKVLKDGDRVEVDADKGVVTLLK